MCIPLFTTDSIPGPFSGRTATFVDAFDGLLCGFPCDLVILEQLCQVLYDVPRLYAVLVRVDLCGACVLSEEVVDDIFAEGIRVRDALPDLDFRPLRICADAHDPFTAVHAFIRRSDVLPRARCTVRA
ncbi:hypothetical protein ES705_42256 [subsurface metagenome]